MVRLFNFSPIVSTYKCTKSVEMRPRLRRVNYEIAFHNCMLFYIMTLRHYVIMTENDEFYHIFIRYSAVMNTKNIMMSDDTR